MAVVHKSTLKRARQAKRRQARNRSVISGVKNVMKKVMSAVEQKNLEAAKASLRQATSALSKAASKGVLKRNTVSRRISRLAAKVNALTSARS